MKYFTVLFFCLLTYFGFQFFFEELSKPDPYPQIFFESPSDLKFLVVGDTGSGDSNQMQVAQQMNRICEQEKPLQGLILLGDQFYPSGITDTEDPQWQKKIWEPYGLPCLKDLPIFPIIGNHDARGNPKALVQMSQKSEGKKRWYMPDRFYSVYFGHLLQIIAFDSTLSGQDFFSPKSPNRFLFHEMKQKKTSWQIVLSHHPFTSSSDKHWTYRYNFLGMIIAPWITSDAWFSGHSHHLEHRIYDSFFTKKSVDLFVLGGGGGPLYPVKPQSEDSQVQFVQSTFGFGFLKISKTSFQIYLFNERGDKLYQHQKFKSI